MSLDSKQLKAKFLKFLNSWEEDGNTRKSLSDILSENKILINPSTISRLSTENDFFLKDTTLSDALIFLEKEYSKYFENHLKPLQGQYIGFYKDQDIKGLNNIKMVAFQINETRTQLLSTKISYEGGFKIIENSILFELYCKKKQPTITIILYGYLDDTLNFENAHIEVLIVHCSYTDKGKINTMPIIFFYDNKNLVFNDFQEKLNKGGLLEESINAIYEDLKVSYKSFYLKALKFLNEKTHLISDGVLDYAELNE